MSDAPPSDEESLLITYAVPFLGVCLIAIGIASTVIGGYVVIQDAVGLCGQPTIVVESTDDPRQGAPQLSYDDLSPAEQAAVDTALESPLEEGQIDGELANEDALLEGAVVTINDQQYIVAIASLDSCHEANPLLAPIGVVAILIGVAGVLTPPIYRKMEDIEAWMRRGPGN